MCRLCVYICVCVRLCSCLSLYVTIQVDVYVSTSRAEKRIVLLFHLLDVYVSNDVCVPSLYMYCVMYEGEMCTMGKMCLSLCRKIKVLSR